MMTMWESTLLSNLIHVPLAACLGWAAYRAFRYRNSSERDGSRRMITVGRVLVFLVAALTLAGCASSDPLAVAHGPLFPLNAGHWQPSPQDLDAPPKIAVN
jgi:hypothetical protein